jgi:hypothetical protein
MNNLLDLDEWYNMMHVKVKLEEVEHPQSLP